MHRIAISSLLEDRGKLLAALTGVTAATVLMLTQVGIYRGFGEASSSVIRWIGGDVWVMARSTRHVDQGALLPAGAESALLDHACVVAARPAIVTWTRFRRADGSGDSLQLVGVDPDGPHAVPWSMHRGLPADLSPPGRVTVDVSDLAIVGADGSSAAAGDVAIGAPLEIASSVVHVGAITRGIRSNFGIHPMVFASTRTAREVLGLGSTQATFWVADLRDPSCAASVIGSVGRDPELTAMSTEDFVDRTEREFLETSGVGGALAFIALLGFFVAAVVVAQTLASSLQQHRRELAMLKALGATPLELLGFVGWQAGFLASAGVTLGVALAFGLRALLTDLAVPVVLEPAVVLGGALTVVLLCGVASLGSVRAVLRLEAHEVLR